jgi:hypothetical protein
MHSKITVVRSPARVCWHVLYNGVLLGTRDTKSEANALKGELLCTLQKQCN